MTAGGPGLDARITDTFSVLSLLCAVVAAYLAAIWPVIAALLKENPEVERDKRRAADSCIAYHRLAVVLASGGTAVFAVMCPLLKDIYDTLGQGAFSPLRASVSLFAVFLAGGIVTGLVLSSQLRKHARVLREPRKKAGRSA